MYKGTIAHRCDFFRAPRAGLPLFRYLYRLGTDRLGCESPTQRGIDRFVSGLVINGRSLARPWSITRLDLCQGLKWFCNAVRSYVPMYPSPCALFFDILTVDALRCVDSISAESLLGLVSRFVPSLRLCDSGPLRFWETLDLIEIPRGSTMVKLIASVLSPLLPFYSIKCTSMYTSLPTSFLLNSGAS